MVSDVSHSCLPHTKLLIFIFICAWDCSRQKNLMHNSSSAPAILSHPSSCCFGHALVDCSSTTRPSVCLFIREASAYFSPSIHPYRHQSLCTFQSRILCALYACMHSRLTVSGLLPLIALCLLILSKPWVSVLSLSHGYSLTGPMSQWQTQICNVFIRVFK